MFGFMFIVLCFFIHMHNVLETVICLQQIRIQHIIFNSLLTFILFDFRLTELGGDFNNLGKLCDTLIISFLSRSEFSGGVERS